MHGYARKRGWLAAALLALALVAALPEAAFAKPEPGARPRGFRLFARTLGALVINRVYCGLNSQKAQICVDSLGSSTIGGGFWPKGSAQQYVFNSGLQIAGKINNPGGAWNGDITGAFFFDPKGTTEHGEEIQPIFNTQDPADFAAWPDVALVPEDPRVPQSQEIFFQTLLGRKNASQGDVHFLTWDGNPTFVAGRPHPLGVLVEHRGLGWNFPAGNQDIVYLVFTFYNVTSRQAASYATARPEIQPLLLQLGTDFQTRNEAAFNIQLPDAGYTIDSLFAGFAADQDVTNSAGTNFCSVNLPFALGFCWEHTFQQTDPGPYDPSIFGPPFFAGSGFVGVKYLRGPGGPGAIQLFSNTINAATGFRDPQNVGALFRYLSGNISAAAGDQACNHGNHLVTRICFINPTSADARFYQSSPSLTLAPGDFQSIVVGYIFAAPVAIPGFTPAGNTDVRPGDPRRLTDAALLPAGANFVDSLTGFRGWTDANANGVVEQSEFRFVRGSLLGKSQVAQDIFDKQFLLPFGPESPEFFLVPGSNQVSILWRQSPTEQTGDPFFAVASDPGAPGNANSLYDPNYRQLDVEGYRVYRGRVDNPDALTLLAQFDYSGTVIRDYTGQIQPQDNLTCAPELGLPVANCPAPFNFVAGSGLAATEFVEYPLVGNVIQVELGPAGRLIQATPAGTAFIIKADTAVTGLASGQFPPIEDTGVPFSYVDRDVRNGFRYFYSVTAFDINSFQSGPSSIESARVTKAVTPSQVSTTLVNTADVTISFLGRNAVLDNTAPTPTINATTGVFSGPQPASNGFDFGLADFVQNLLAGPGTFALSLDSLTLGDVFGGVPAVYWFTGRSGASAVVFSLPIVQEQSTITTSAFTFFPAVPVDQSLAARYGGSNQFALNARIEPFLIGNYYTSAYGRGCVNGASGFGTASAACDFNGSRWFSGANETFANPNAGNSPNAGTPVVMTNLNNAGALTNVTTVHTSMSYQSAQNVYREVEGVLGGAKRAADYRVHWGAAGRVDSVIDVTHNLPVPFDSSFAGGTWGILTQGLTNTAASYDQRAVLSTMDMMCVEPLRSSPSAGGRFVCATRAFMTQTATLGQIAIWSSISTNSRTVAPQPQGGFVMYIAGEITIFEMAALPTQGSVWTLRTYVGSIRGGTDGGARNFGSYIYTPRRRPFTAVGAQIRVDFDVVNVTRATTKEDLERVHTVPDPYYVTNDFEVTTENKVIKFVNLPKQAIIRIYTTSGVLVDIIEHNSATDSGSEDWNLRNRNEQVVASGVYFYHLESGDARRVGRFTIVNFAQ